MEIMKCTNCDKELTEDMEIEYSEEITSYFCNPDCATNYYYDYMRSTPFDVKDRYSELKDRNIKIKNGKLYDTSFDY